MPETARYRIRVRGHLDPDWWDSLTVIPCGDGTTTIVSPAADPDPIARHLGHLVLRTRTSGRPAARAARGRRARRRGRRSCRSGVEAEREQPLRARTQVQCEVTEADHLSGDVAEAVHAKQAAVLDPEDHLEQAAAPRDRAARRGGERAAADDVGLAARRGLLLGEPDARDLGHRPPPTTSPAA